MPDVQTHVLTINGTFPSNRGNPTVTLANTPLTVTDHTDALIHATLPNVAPGTYVLVLSFRHTNFDPISLTIPGAPAGDGGDGGVPHGMREFAASDSWVVPPGVTRLLVEVWGAGGGGGADPCNAPLQGGHGGAGAYSRTAMSVSGGDTVTVTVGQGGSPGGPGGSSSVADGSNMITSGGGGGGSDADCQNSGPDGSPGTPDPNAEIGRSSALGRRSSSNAWVFLTYDPAPGSIQPLGAFGGLGGGPNTPPGSGGNGYVFIQW